MAYTMTGTVAKILDEQTFASGFSKREFVLTDDSGKFPQEICFECVKEKMSLLDDVNQGEKLTVHFDIRGREYNGRYFNNLNAWKIEKGAASGGGGGDDAGGTPSEPADLGAEDDIPF